MNALKLKICGMKYNTAAVAGLEPDYLGFIFYEGSPRNYDVAPVSVSHAIQKVGVFVDASLIVISEAIKIHQLDVVQLHGAESPEFCRKLKQHYKVDLWKVFSVKDHFNFDQLLPYEAQVDAFLFDTKGASKGGNGFTFNWDILKGYTATKPIVLSGGIGLDELDDVFKLREHNIPITTIDINSKFELEPGLKNIDQIEIIKQKLSERNQNLKA